MNKLDLSIKDYKELFSSERTKKYNYFYISTLWNKFENNFKGITKQEEDSFNLFINLLSKNEDFILKLSEKF